jgi:hypothetical protein
MVPCGYRAAAYIVGAASIPAPAGDRWEKRKRSGRRKWPHWCTTAAALLAVPMPGCATTAAGLHPNGDICGAFLPSKFWTAPIRCGKMSFKPVKLPTTKNRPVAVGFVTQALAIRKI